MKKREDFLEQEQDCFNALSDFDKMSSAVLWLEKYAALYKAVTIQPGKRPRIISSHFEGESFDGIRRFARLYEKVKAMYD